MSPTEKQQIFELHSDTEIQVGSYRDSYDNGLCNESPIKLGNKQPPN